MRQLKGEFTVLPRICLTVVSFYAMYPWGRYYDGDENRVEQSSLTHNSGS